MLVKMKKYYGINLNYYFLILVCSFVVISCQNTTMIKSDTFEKDVKETATAYFETFAERSDWEKLCSFYREDVQFKDIILQLDLDSLWQFKRFYKWDEEGNRFKKLSPEQKHLTVNSLVVDGDMAVARGRVNPFYYDENLIDSEWGMEFTIWLRFDENLKIFEQIDWMEYGPGVLENMLARIEENGFEATPEWLDLSN